MTHKDTNPIVSLVCRTVSPFIMLYALYVIFHCCQIGWVCVARAVHSHRREFSVTCWPAQGCLPPRVEDYIDRSSVRSPADCRVRKRMRQVLLLMTEDVIDTESTRCCAIFCETLNRAVAAGQKESCT